MESTFGPSRDFSLSRIPRSSGQLKLFTFFFFFSFSPFLTFHFHHSFLFLFIIYYLKKPSLFARRISHSSLGEECEWLEVKFCRSLHAWPHLQPWDAASEAECGGGGGCCCSVTKSHPTLCDPMDCSLPGSCPSLSPVVCSDSRPLHR